VLELAWVGVICCIICIWSYERRAPEPAWYSHFRLTHSHSGSQLRVRARGRGACYTAPTNVWASGVSDTGRCWFCPVSPLQSVYCLSSSVGRFLPDWIRYSQNSNLLIVAVDLGWVRAWNLLGWVYWEGLWHTAQKVSSMGSASRPRKCRKTENVGNRLKVYQFRGRVQGDHISVAYIQRP
jgi:hypothetical protein